jgi:hypothetical protein
MADIYLHQIYYDDASKGRLLPGFIPLDNSKNERPDWFEFWVMLNFLRHNVLQDDAWYGFVSPKFKEKTGLSAHDVVEKITVEGENADVLLCTVAWDQVAYFLNPWEQGEVVHPGIRALSQRFFDHAGYQVDLKTLVSDSYSTVFSNFVVARAAYWQRWQVLAEQFLAFVEGASPVGQALSDVTHYYGKKTHYPMKTFVQERFPALILSGGGFRVIKSDPSDIRPPNKVLFKPTLETRRLLQACDLMKSQYLRTSDPSCLAMFWKLRDQLVCTPPCLKT